VLHPPKIWLVYYVCVLFCTMIDDGVIIQSHEMWCQIDYTELIWKCPGYYTNDIIHQDWITDKMYCSRIWHHIICQNRGVTYLATTLCKCKQNMSLLQNFNKKEEFCWLNPFIFKHTYIVCLMLLYGFFCFATIRTLKKCILSQQFIDHSQWLCKLVV